MRKSQFDEGLARALEGDVIRTVSNEDLAAGLVSNLGLDEGNEILAFANNLDGGDAGELNFTRSSAVWALSRKDPMKTTSATTIICLNIRSNDLIYR